MGLLKQSWLIICCCLLCSCSSKNNTSSAKDLALLSQTIQTARETNQDHLWTSGSRINLNQLVSSNFPSALAMYRKECQETGAHDYSFLQDLGLAILKNADNEFDVESKVLALHGIGLAKHNDLLPILEKAIFSEEHLVQLFALQTLIKLPEDAALRLVVKACSSQFLDVALMSVFHLAQSKHPLAFELAESLMDKVPKPCVAFFPGIFSLMDTPKSIAKLRKCLTHAEEGVRLAAISATGNAMKFQLLPEIRALSKQHSTLQQEVCADALGKLGDETSIETLERLSKSQSSNVSMSALHAMYKLNVNDAQAQLENYALKKNPYAIALLSGYSNTDELLEALGSASPQDPAVLNASIALLNKKNPKCLRIVRSILIPENPNILITRTLSPANSLLAYKLVGKNYASNKYGPSAQQASLDIRHQILEDCAALDETSFLELASDLIEADQNDLIFALTQHLMIMKTSQSIKLLKQWQQKVGSPYTRICASLALMKMDVPGPWQQAVIDWICSKRHHPLVKFRMVSKWSFKSLPTPHEMNPLETSKIMTEAYLTLAQKQNDETIELILNHLENSFSKNKYALAGLLILATE